jgi:YegS/Rv2252/BmrU family lipid kinase
MSVPYAKVIVNPAAGGYSIHREWPRISRQLRDIGLSFDYEYTEGVGHAIELARAAVDDGYRYLIAVGGDGTVNEVVNGILRSTSSGSTILGIVSAGTACSFARSAGIPQDYSRACSLLTGQGRLLIDVGVVEYKSEGQSLQRFFVNDAGMGFGAAAVEVSKRLPKHFGPTIKYYAYVVRGLRSLFSYRNKHIALCTENKIEAMCAFAVVVVNGRYIGGGMYIAPHAELDDGLLDVVIVGDAGKFELLKIWPTLYSGSHITHPKTRVERVTSVTIQSSERVLVEADGELLGECPASSWVLPSALTIVV